MASLLAGAKDLAYNPDHTRWMIPLLLVADAALSGVIIEKIPCSSSRPLSLSFSRYHVALTRQHFPSTTTNEEL